MRSMYRRVLWRVRKRKGRLALAAAITAIAVLVYMLWPGRDLRAGSRELPPGSIHVASHLPTSYRIVYRVEDYAGGHLLLTTKTVQIRRPFDSRVETRTGAPPRGNVIDTTINGFARLRTPRALIAAPPVAAPQDSRPDVLLRQATRDGYALKRERRRVAGRICRVYRIAGDTGANSLPRVRRSTRSYTDLCFDAAGLLLEAVAYSDGKLLDRRIAVEVRENPRFKDALFDVSGNPIDPRAGGGTVRRLTPSSRTPGSFWELADPPIGFVHKGRYAVVPPQRALANPDPQTRASIVATVDDVWVKGPDVLIVEQGGTLGGGEAFGADPNAQHVTVGALGRGDLLYALRSSEIRVKTGGGHFVVLEGTLEPSRLLALARSLEKVTGGTLTFE